jgi:hypothetical protein
MIPLLLAACTATDGDDGEATLGDSAARGDTAPDDTDDTDHTGDTGDTGDTGTARQGVSGQRGTATVGDTYTGTDERYFVADRGRGEDVCRISYAVDSVGARTDCIGDAAPCDWAFDVVYGAAQLLAESGAGCLGVGIDLTAIEGSTAGYGYVDDYYGHTSVLMVVDESGAWNPATFASFNRGALEYDWEYGLVDY